MIVRQMKITSEFWNDVSMTKRSGKDNLVVRTGTLKSKLMKRNCDEKKLVKNVCIRSNNVKRWNRLKKKFGAHSDSEFLEYLLNLAEGQIRLVLILSLRLPYGANNTAFPSKYFVPLTTVVRFRLLVDI